MLCLSFRRSVAPIQRRISRPNASIPVHTLLHRRYAVATATAEPTLSGLAGEKPTLPQEPTFAEPTFTEPVFTGLRKPKKKVDEEDLPAPESESEAEGLNPKEALERKREQLRKSVEKLQQDLRARKNAKDTLGITNIPQVTKEATTVFEMKPSFGRMQALNAIFSLAAFPVHIWGYSLNIDPFLLVFPFSFSVLWLAYSHKKASRSIKTVRALEGHKQLELTPYSFFGTAGKPFVVDKSDVHVILDMPKVDRDRRNHIDIAMESAIPGLKKKKRDMSLRKKRVKDQTNGCGRYCLYFEKLLS